MKTEQWKTLKTINSNYEISNQGRLRRKKEDGEFIILAGATTQSNGNYHFHKIDGKKYYTHRLVMLAFIGECPQGKEVDHINRNALDNRLENLRYLSRKQNCLRGEDLAKKLNDEKVKAILFLSSIEGLTRKSIGQLFNVSDTTIGKIINRKMWSHVER